VIVSGIALSLEKAFSVIGAFGLGSAIYGLIWSRPRDGAENDPFFGIRYRKAPQRIRRGTIVAVLGGCAAGLVYLASH